MVQNGKYCTMRPPRCKSFLWLLHHRKLNTNARLSSRGADNDGFCTFCNLPEDTEHLFLHCPRAQSFWGSIGVTSSNLLQIEALWEIALPGPTCSSLQTRSTVLTGLLLNLWKCRNAQVFDHVQEANFVVFARCAPDFCLWQNRQRETVDKFCNEDSL